MTRHISATFRDHESAAAAVQSLRANDFLERETTIIAKATEDDRARLQSELGGEPASAGAWAGSALGAALAGAAGLLSIALIPATPLLMAGGAALGGAAGNVFGGMGASEDEIERMKRALEEGGVLIIVHQETEGRTAVAADVLRKAGADQVNVTG